MNTCIKLLSMFYNCSTVLFWQLAKTLLKYCKNFGNILASDALIGGCFNYFSLQKYNDVFLRYCVCGWVYGALFCSSTVDYYIMLWFAVWVHSMTDRQDLRHLNVQMLIMSCQHMWESAPLCRIDSSSHAAHRELSTLPSDCKYLCTAAAKLYRIVI